MGAIRMSRSEPATGAVNWPRVLEIVQRSRALDELEETRLVPERKVLYQFSARGHDVTQALLAQHIDGPSDGLAVYYRSRPLMLGLGLELDEALASTMMRVGGMSEGRDIGAGAGDMVDEADGGRGRPRSGVRVRGRHRRQMDLPIRCGGRWHQGY